MPHTPKVIAERAMSVPDDIERLYEDYRSLLAPYLWASEDDRWTELVFCLLNQCSPNDPDGVRSALAILGDLKLLDPTALLHLDDPDGHESIMFSHVLGKNGFSKEDAQRAAKLLRAAAEVTNEQYGGKIQRFLREHGKQMRDELMDTFSALDLTEPQLHYALTHWLQNVLSLPITLESEAVRKYCAVNNIAVDELVRICDDLGVNPAVVDDLLELSQATGAKTSEMTTRIDSP